MIITIEGNIGSGKSTLLSLCENLKFTKPHIVVFEQVADWTSVKDSSGESIFDLYYKDKERYCYVFQTYVLMSRVSHMLEILRENKDKIVICERSFMTDLEIFAKTLFENGDMTEMEYNVYVSWHKLVRQTCDVPIVGQIYLRCSPEMCLTRIEKRNRQSEHLIEMDYLRDLHMKHEEWLMNTGSNLLPTLVVDGNQNLLEDETAQSCELKGIETFIQGLVMSETNQ